MKRFDLIASVKGLIKDKAYEAGNGASYFIPGMSQEFNLAVMIVGFRLCPWNIIRLCITRITIGLISYARQARDLIGRLTEQFKEYVQGDYKVNEVGNGITMVTSNRAGIALTFADSDLGMYITYMETLA